MIYVSERGASNLRPHQNGCHSVDEILKCVFFNKKAFISFLVLIVGNINDIISHITGQSCGSPIHYSDIIMRPMASQITSLTIVYTTVYSGGDRRKHQSSASLAFVWGIHRWSVNSPHKWPVTQKMFSLDASCYSLHIPPTMHRFVALWYWLYYLLKLAVEHTAQIPVFASSCDVTVMFCCVFVVMH